jgi:non-ribosomal peptide synthase protein (TIGR01720 family)
VRFNLEGHGREDIGPGIDLSRTIGWFTSFFPFNVRLPEKNEPAALLGVIRNRLAELPLKGAGFGVLRHLHGDAELAIRLERQRQNDVLFNYMGVLDIPTALSELGWRAEFGSSRSPEARRHHLIEIDAFVSEGRLTVQWHYSPALHHTQTILDLATDFRARLEALVAMSDNPDQGKTAADFPLAGIDDNELGKLAKLLNKGGNKPT